MPGPLRKDDFDLADLPWVRWKEGRAAEDSAMRAGDVLHRRRVVGRALQWLFAGEEKWWKYRAPA